MVHEVLRNVSESPTADLRAGSRIGVNRVSLERSTSSELIRPRDKHVVRMRHYCNSAVHCFDKKVVCCHMSSWLHLLRGSSVTRIS